MKCLVTGGAGFIGSHIVDALVNTGHSVVVVDNLLWGLEQNINEGAVFYKLDIRHPKLEEIFEDHHFNVVFHCAAIARTPLTIENPIEAHEINTTGTLKLLEYVKKHHVKRFIHSSSNITLAPNTPYYVSKFAAEEYVRIYPKLYNISAIALRYSNVYGKRQREDVPHANVFPALRASKKQYGFIQITGDGEQSRDFTHVSDVVRANLIAMESKYCGVLDICTGKNTSMNQIVKLFSCPIKRIPDRKGDIKHIIQDPEPAKLYLNFTATETIEAHKDEIING